MRAAPAVEPTGAGVGGASGMPLEFLLFDVRPYLKRWHLKLGHWLLTLTFAAVGLVFAVAALRGLFMTMR